MKIGMEEILSGIEYAAVQKMTKELSCQGFKVSTERSSLNDPNTMFDLYAERGDDRRIYELKIGKNRIKRSQFEKLQAEAREMGAKLYIVYLEVPRTGLIEFENLDNMLLEDISAKLPSCLSELDSGSIIDGVDSLELDSIAVSKGIAELEGSARLGITPPCDEDGSDESEDERRYYLDFFFRVSVVLYSDKIVKRYYKFDTGM